MKESIILLTQMEYWQHSAKWVSSTSSSLWPRLPSQSSKIDYEPMNMNLSLARAKEKSKVVDARVGDVEAGQVVRGVAEEMEQSIAGQCDHLWDSLVSPGFRHYQTTEEERKKKQTSGDLCSGFIWKCSELKRNSISEVVDECCEPQWAVKVLFI